MNLPKLKYGNCFIYALIFWLHNIRTSRIRARVQKVRGIRLISAHCIYKNERKILYRSRPKHNGTVVFFKGRPQVIDIDKLK